MKITRQINMIDKVAVIVRLTVWERLEELFTGRLILFIEGVKPIKGETYG